MCTPDTEILLATTAKIMTKGYTWSVFKHHNTVDFFVCFFFAIQPLPYQKFILGEPVAKQWSCSHAF